MQSYVWIGYIFCSLHCYKYFFLWVMNGCQFRKGLCFWLDMCQGTHWSTNCWWTLQKGSSEAEWAVQMLLYAMHLPNGLSLGNPLLSGNAVLSWKACLAQMLLVCNLISIKDEHHPSLCCCFSNFGCFLWFLQWIASFARNFACHRILKEAWVQTLQTVWEKRRIRSSVPMSTKAWIKVLLDKTHSQSLRLEVHVLSPCSLSQWRSTVVFFSGKPPSPSCTPWWTNYNNMGRALCAN